MALPSVVTLASATVVVAAGIGLAAAAASRAGERPAADHSLAQPAATSPARHHDKQRAPSTHHLGASHPGGSRHRHDAAVPKTLVEVYNNSVIANLAADKAAILQGAGWNVASTDNWYGDIPQTTVYYPHGLRREARQLAVLLRVNRVRPAVDPMQLDRLTVIFTSP
jgi:hypothetical protein